LLTSDGVHDFINSDELESFITTEMAEAEKCRAILQAAKNAGSTDDMSVVIIVNRED